MLESLNLLSNTIAPPPLTSAITIDSDITNWHGQYAYLRNSSTIVLNSCDKEIFVVELKKAYIITEHLRATNACTALNFYYNFYKMLTSEFYKISDTSKRRNSVDFIKCADFTELFYNIAKLKSELGNRDEALFYISLADNEFSTHSGAKKGAFIKYLIKSRGYFLWNVIPFITSDFDNYKNSNKHQSNYEGTLKDFDIKISKEVFGELLDDFETETLYQFVSSLRDYSSFNTGSAFKEEETHYKSIRQFRILGDLAWIFESYLKSKLSQKYQVNTNETLDTIISQHLKKYNETCSKKYSKRQAELSKKYSKDNLEFYTLGLSELLDEIKVVNQESYLKVYAIYLLILKNYRNYSAHYLDNSLKLGDSYTLRLRIMLTIMCSFLITKKIYSE